MRSHAKLLLADVEISLGVTAELESRVRPGEQTYSGRTNGPVDASRLRKCLTGAGFSWVKGKHEFKFGWDHRRLRTIGFDNAGSNGQYIFNRTQTGLPGTVASAIAHPPAGGDIVIEHPTGTLRVAGLPALANGFLPRFVGRFLADRPKLDIVLSGLVSHAVVAAVAEPGAESGLLSDQAYRQIRDLIVTLDLPPGAVVSEAELMSRLGIPNGFHDFV